MADLRNAVLVGSNRVPFGKVGGAYAAATNLDLLTAALDGLVARFGLAGERVGEVAAGAVLKHSRDFNLTREAVLSSALSAATPAYDVQQACATSLTAAVQLSNRIRVGQLDVAIAGGVDSASDSPIAVNDGLRRKLLRLNAAKTPLDKLKTLATVRPADLAPEVPRAAEPRTGLNMGQHQAITTAHWGITRQAQDELAAASHHNLAKAWDAGFFDDLVTPYLGLTRDQALRADTSVERLAKLRPVFGDGPDATMTAGNSTPLSDGAAAVLLAEEGWARARNLPVLARIVDAETAAVDYLTGTEGLLMAPAHATARLLGRTGLSLQDFDFYEIHEAFASTVLCTLAAWESDEYCRDTLGLDGALGSIDRAKLNVNGSSLAAGHPFAATGARILGSLGKMLADKGRGSRGLISVCAAGGQGVVAIVEAI
ncbi:acetyl-CoA C-acetyltransferase [Micropruina sonneratiae]|uniref:acetyl-CoA C-acetyltransferase n=1 Tax=Micropruina sonneratiae TaxID=2986940 RepID=UPI00222612DD|nr:acetyl-CoA C-acetyltransferase [Micropruina sp. KQZ13P-5]MCW3159514.1 acetyl-CoA C-acetyltransferase [Micropruina sp. KQZ13P-5]